MHSTGEGGGLNVEDVVCPGHFYFGLLTDLVTASVQWRIRLLVSHPPFPSCLPG